jgi:two-component system sensor histidine kinase DesK
MTELALPPTALPVWAMRYYRVFLFGMVLPFGAIPALFMFSRTPSLSAIDKSIVVAGAFIAMCVQLRHSFALARGTKPRGWPLTWFVICACTYAPIGSFGIDWSHLQWFVVASSAMLLPRPLAVVGVLGPIVGTSFAVGLTVAREGTSVPGVIVWVVYYCAVMGMGGAALYWAARLARLLDELYAARTELAELAVGRERLRVSRDLHDLLGHSLSAVSLKGDLALRLLPSDPARARAEIAGLTGVARSALRDMRAVARDEHVVSLRAELDAAVAVLDAAGVAVSVDVDDVPPAVEAVLAWAVREGATNILRHSTASCCSFTAACQAGAVRLEIVNDGASAVPGAGSGLAGLADRAWAVGGSAVGAATGAGEFRLVVEVPA